MSLIACLLGRRETKTSQMASPTPTLAELGRLTNTLVKVKPSGPHEPDWYRSIEDLSRVLFELIVFNSVETACEHFYFRTSTLHMSLNWRPISTTTILEK